MTEAKVIVPYIASSVLGYLLGSVPFALVIGKVFYKTDVREHGSGNLGGGNAGRVLGKKAGIAVMTLDILKVTLAMLISSLMESGELILEVSALSCAIGHCFPVFARFKGGKAVATMYGFLFGMVTVGHNSPLLFIIPLVVFLIVIFISKIVALSSVVSSLAVLVYSAIFEDSLTLTVTLAVFLVFMVIRHRKNFIRMIKGEENKVKWIGRKND